MIVLISEGRPMFFFVCGAFSFFFFLWPSILATGELSSCQSLQYYCPTPDSQMKMCFFTVPLEGRGEFP